MEWRRGDYEISTDRARLDRDAIHRFLSEEAYWSLGIPRERVDRSIEESLCFGLYERFGFSTPPPDRTRRLMVISYPPEMIYADDR